MGVVSALDGKRDGRLAQPCGVRVGFDTFEVYSQKVPSRARVRVGRKTQKRVERVEPVDEIARLARASYVVVEGAP
jgi:hypothetical protein